MAAGNEQIALLTEIRDLLRENVDAMRSARSAARTTMVTKVVFYVIVIGFTVFSTFFYFKSITSLVPPMM